MGSVGKVFGAGAEQLDVRDPCVGEPLPGRVDRVLGEVVAVERRRGERLGEQLEREPGAAPDVGDHRTLLELRLDAVEGRDHDRDQQRPRHRPEHSLHVVRGLGTEVVVGEPDARLERLGEAVDEANRPRLTARGGREARRVAAREHQRADVGELESVSLVVLEQPAPPRWRGATRGASARATPSVRASSAAVIGPAPSRCA